METQNNNPNLFSIASSELDLEKHRGKIDYIKDKIKAKEKSARKVAQLEQKLQVAKNEDIDAGATVEKLKNNTDINCIPERQNIFQKVWEYVAFDPIIFVFLLFIILCVSAAVIVIFWGLTVALGFGWTIFLAICVLLMGLCGFYWNRV